MDSTVDESSAAYGGMASSILFVTETSRLLNRVHRTILASAITSTVLMVISILIFGGFAERLERLVPFHQEFIVAVVIVLIIVPISVYLTHRATSTMKHWRDHLDGISYALRFESNSPAGESPSLRLANQTFKALTTDRTDRQYDPHDFADKQKDSMNLEVFIPGQITRALSGHKGAVVAKRLDGKPILARDLSEIVGKIRSLHVRLWRLLIVSDKEFPLETINYNSSLSKQRVGFFIDLIEETHSGFSVVSLGG